VNHPTIQQSQLPLPDALLEYLVNHPHHSAKESNYKLKTFLGTFLT
jgi:hypothetical protein